MLSPFNGYWEPAPNVVSTGAAIFSNTIYLSHKNGIRAPGLPFPVRSVIVCRSGRYIDDVQSLGGIY